MITRKKTAGSTQRIRIKLMAYDHRLLDLAASEIVGHAKKTGATVVGPIPLPTRREIFTVLRGPHIDKKSRELFQIKTHKRLLEIIDPTAKTIDSLRNYAMPAGVSVAIK